MDAESTLKQIYRRLASALHPDREPDEIKRVEKTLLMAQVNAANEKKDLLTMLRLQLRLEQIEPAAISLMAAEKLRHYNRMLKDQLKSLQLEQTMLTDRARDEFNLHFGPVNAKSLQKALRAEVNKLTVDLKIWQYEYGLIQTDKELKAWARYQTKSMNELSY